MINSLTHSSMLLSSMLSSILSSMSSVSSMLEKQHCRKLVLFLLSLTLVLSSGEYDVLAFTKDSLINHRLNQSRYTHFNTRTNNPTQIDIHTNTHGNALGCTHGYGFEHRNKNRNKNGRMFLNASAATVASITTSISTSTSTIITPLSTAVATAAATRGIGSYYLTRIIFLRGLAFVYFVAFLIAHRQNKGLIGDNGITPARDVLNELERKGKEKRKRREEWWYQQTENGKTKDALPVPDDAGIFYILKSTKVARIIGHFLNNSHTFQNIREVTWDRSDRLGRMYPTMLWFLSKANRENNMNKYLDRIAKVGLGLSLSMFLLGAANVPLLLSLWVCQRSLMSVGGPWYGFGWEPQLAELTFHAMFMAPLLSLNAIPYKSPVPIVTIWAMRWFLFRIMIGAGLIKLRSGDPKWKMRNLSAMNYFYETQPVPNPLTKSFHFAPKLWHKFEVLSNHVVELIAPWLLIMPWLGRKWTIAGGLIQLVFQSILITSGNLSFLNWLTMLPAIYCLDDAFVSKLFTPGYTTSASIASYTHLSASSAGIGGICRKSMNIFFTVLIAKLSIPVVKNLMSEKQLMNASFDPLRLVNTYGAFGTVEEERIELIIEAAEDYNGPWKEYQFKVKPGDISCKPRFISPYHYRLDWLMWIASIAGGIERSPWIFSFLLKLLEQDKEVCSLLKKDPFGSNDDNNGDDTSIGRKPKYIRVEKYRYKFNNAKEGNYWTRERMGRYFPRQGICSAEMLKEYIAIQKFQL